MAIDVEEDVVAILLVVLEGLIGIDDESLRKGRVWDLLETRCNALEETRNKLEIRMRQNGPRGDNKWELVMDVWISKSD